MVVDPHTLARCSRCHPRHRAVAARLPAPLPEPPGQASAGSAGASDSLKAQADLIVRAKAMSLRYVSGNDTRELMDAAGVPEQLRGSRFAAAVAAGLLEPAGYVTATNPGNHGKPIRLYRSLVHRRPEPCQPALEALEALEGMGGG